MSDIVGTCTDCIISGPRTPINTLNTTLRVSSGQNQITRQLATIPVAFDATLGLVSRTLSLTGAQTLVLAQGSGAFILSCSAPLVLTLVKPVAGGSPITSTITVNGLILLDDSYSSVTITNPNASGSTAITGQVFYVPAV